MLKPEEIIANSLLVIARPERVVRLAALKESDPEMHELVMAQLEYYRELCERRDRC